VLEIELFPLQSHKRSIEDLEDTFNFIEPLLADLDHLNVVLLEVLSDALCILEGWQNHVVTKLFYVISHS
jgi:hypothetical protein